MKADFPVVLDACALAPAKLCDLLLRLAETPRLYLPRWSEAILTEVGRVQIEKLHFGVDYANSWQIAVREHFPEALVDVHQRLIEACDNDADDRHVLATAIQCNAELIVTQNLRHFPRAALEPWGICAVHPADFLLALYSLDAGVVVSKLEAIARERQQAPEVALSRLSRSVPAFSRHVAAALGWDLTCE